MINSDKKDMLIARTFPKYCGNIIAATLASTLSSFVDGCITGRMLGGQAMAAFGIAMPFILILIVVPSIILSSGGSICCAIFIGDNNRERANTNFTSCCFFGAVVGLAAALVCLFLSKWIVGVTGVTGFVASEAVGYMRGYALGAVPTVLLSILMYYANLDGHEKVSLVAVAVMTVVDIVLDLLLGVRMNLGLFGMALATSISYICAVAVFAVIFLKGGSSYSFVFKNLKTEFADIIKTGYPSALNTLLVSARCFILNMILVSLSGQEAVAAFSFQSNFNQFFVAISSGISTTVSALTGIFIGEKDSRKIFSSLKAGFRVGIFLSGIFMLILLLGAPLFTDLLISGTATEKIYSVNALRLFSLSMPFSTICIVFISFYQTLGNRKLASSIAVGHGLVFIVLSALILPVFIGLNGVWLSTLAGEIIMLTVLYFYASVRKKQMPHNLEQMIIMDNNLLENEKDVFCDSGSAADAQVQRRIENGLQDYLVLHKTDEDVITAWKNIWENLTGKCAEDAYADVQSYFNGGGKDTTVNIRFTGEDIFSMLDRGEGEMIKKELNSKNLEFYYRYGAGISFINIKQEDHKA